MTKIAKNLIFSFILVFGLGLVAVSSASAVTVDNLLVEFENQPLFSEANFIPGDGVTRFIKVSNNSPDAQNIIIEAINVTNSGDLGDDLELTIKEGATELYQDTLANFFSDGEVSLSSLASGSNTQYDLNVRFPDGADNTSMEDSLAFDILIGFEGEGGSISEGCTENCSSGGGGGGSVILGLVISNEAVFDIIPAAGTAQAYWSTSYQATSQVVYGPASGAPYVLNLSDPKYGYPFATPEDSTKTMNHFMDLSGLAQGETYVYRVISHASPATVSFEHTFTVPVVDDGGSNNGDGVEKGEPENIPAVSGSTIEDGGTPSSADTRVTLALGSDPVASGVANPVFYGDSADIPAASQGEEVQTPKEAQDNPDEKPAGLASVFSVSAFTNLFSSECFYYLILIFIIAYLARALWEKRNEGSHLSKKELISKKIMYFIKITVGLLILAVIFGKTCSITLLLIILVFLLAWYSLNERKKRREK